MPLLTRPADLSADIKTALVHFHTPKDEPDPLRCLYLYRRLNGAEFRNARQRNNQLLLDLLERLAEVDPRGHALLSKRYLDREIMRAAAHSINVAENYAFEIQKQALEQTADILWAMEQEALDAKRATWRSRIGATVHNPLLGIEPHVDRLWSVLTAKEPSWLISIQGLGGVGKTSLATVLLERVVDEAPFADIGWVSAQTAQLSPVGAIRPVNDAPVTAEQCARDLIQQLMPDRPITPAMPLQTLADILSERLAAEPHLIVIDNLETVQDIDDLLPLVERLANPARFLLTSRHEVPLLSSTFRFDVPPLSRANALALLRQEAMSSGATRIGDCADADLAVVYETVGGNPLALRLVAGLLYKQSLDQVLASLTEAPDRSTRNLYTYIYRQAWDSLAEESRNLFLAMPLADPEGETVDYLADVADVTVQQAQDELDELVRRSLVDVRLDAGPVRYGIHSLTRSFLLNDQICW